MPVPELPPEKLRLQAKTDLFEGKTSAELGPVEEIIGQNRAIQALKFGLDIKGKGFNVYAAGLPGTGKHTGTRRYLQTISKLKPTPPDWCYVNNFRDSYQPEVLRFPSGKAKIFQKDLRKFIEDIKRAVPSALQSEEFANRRETVSKRAEEERDKILSDLNKEAAEYSFAIQSTQIGITLTPLSEGKPLSEEVYQQLPIQVKEKFEKSRDTLRSKIEKTARQVTQIGTTANEELRKLRDDAVHYAIGHLMETLQSNYHDIPEVTNYLNELREDILENAALFAGGETEKKPPQEDPPGAEDKDLLFRKYEVNVIVDNSELKGAPVLTEDNPTFNNLFGKIEYEAHYGTLSTDFTLIKGGSLHEANGGYLILSTNGLVRNPASYDGLKRALQNGEISIEDPSERQGSPTRSLSPEPIPLDVKVILIGEPSTYQMLYAGDPDFQPLFKVKAQFDDVIPRTDENMKMYGRFIHTLCESEGLRHLQASAIAKVVEYGSRLAEDQSKLSTRFSDIADVVREGNFYAAQDNSPQIQETHILKTLQEKTFRSNLEDEKIKEAVAKGILLIETSGSKVGQANGLSVIALGDFEFGQASRVTASIGLGREGIIDVEREAKLGGPTHTKGVLILSGYLTEKYAHDKPLTLSCRLVFEQSYGGVDGDSASSTELYAILSELSGLPIKQNFAMTGSVNQKGEVQPIGGVNEKIEGFYHTCKVKGLKGDESVMIPQSNVQHLMLKEEVVEAVKQGKFHIYAVNSVDEGIELLTGVKAGGRGEGGKYEAETVHYLVNKRLKDMAKSVAKFASPLREPHDGRRDA